MRLFLRQTQPTGSAVPIRKKLWALVTEVEREHLNRLLAERELRAHVKLETDAQRSTREKATRELGALLMVYELKGWSRKELAQLAGFKGVQRIGEWISFALESRVPLASIAWRITPRHPERWAEHRRRSLAERPPLVLYEIDPVTQAALNSVADALEIDRLHLAAEYCRYFPRESFPYDPVNRTRGARKPRSTRVVK